MGLRPVEGQRRIAQVEGQRPVFVQGEPSGTKTPGGLCDSAPSVSPENKKRARREEMGVTQLRANDNTNSNTRRGISRSAKREENIQFSTNRLASEGNACAAFMAKLGARESTQLMI